MDWGVLRVLPCCIEIHLDANLVSRDKEDSVFPLVGGDSIVSEDSCSQGLSLVVGKVTLANVFEDAGIERVVNLSHLLFQLNDVLDREPEISPDSIGDRPSSN